MATLEDGLGVFEQQLFAQRQELETRLAEFERRMQQQQADVAQRLAAGEGAMQQLTVQVAAAVAAQQGISASIVELQAVATRQQGEVEASRVMLTAMQAAVTDIQTRITSLASRPGGSGGGGANTLIDTRVIGKPWTFHGKASEWRDWAFVFKMFCTAVDPVLGARMEHHSLQEAGTPLDRLSEEDKRLSNQLAYMLILMTKDVALEKARNAVEPTNGLETWRIYH